MRTDTDRAIIEIVKIKRDELEISQRRLAVIIGTT